jgi:mRNA interferase RelE/StbE
VTGGYRVDLTRQAQRQYDALDRPIRRRLDPVIEALGTDPRPPGSKLLVGTPGLRRVRMGDWRVIYTVKDTEVLVLVVAIGHRREIYR